MIALKKLIFLFPLSILVLFFSFPLFSADEFMTSEKPLYKFSLNRIPMAGIYLNLAKLPSPKTSIGVLIRSDEASIYFDPAKIPHLTSDIWLLMEWDHFRILFSQKELLKKRMLLSSFIPLRLQDALHDHRALNMTRKECIETQTNPEFYSIYYKGTPLNIFNLPTLHGLPIDALHSGIQNTILAIAQSAGGQLIAEIDDDYYTEEEEQASSLKDPRTHLDIEVCVQRDFKAYIEVCQPIFEADPDIGIKLQKEEEESLRKNYREGWTNSLDSVCRNTLSLIARAMELTIEDFNRIDPYYVYSILASAEVAKVLQPQPPYYTLDNHISNIFSIFGKRVTGLENEDDRFEAKKESICATLPTCSHSFGTLKLLLQAVFQKISLCEKYICSSDSDSSIAQAPSVYIRPLDDLNFDDPMTRTYLRGTGFKDNTEEVAIRNQRWWNTRINPTLEERILSPLGGYFSPILYIWGAHHNSGRLSILDLIRNKPGFEARRIHRDQFLSLIRSLSQGISPAKPASKLSLSEIGAQREDPSHQSH
jgi:hypothetical protein